MLMSLFNADSHTLAVSISAIDFYLKSLESKDSVSSVTWYSELLSIASNISLEKN